MISQSVHVKPYINKSDQTGQIFLVWAINNDGFWASIEKYSKEDGKTETIFFSLSIIFFWSFYLLNTNTSVLI